MKSTPQGFEVLYDHCGIVVINKAFSIPSQPNKRGDLDVYTQLTERYDYVGQHHRLDQPASGLPYFTTDQSHNHAISQAFKNHCIERSYWIWVVGEPTSTGSWKQQFGRQTRANRFYTPPTSRRNQSAECDPSNWADTSNKTPCPNEWLSDHRRSKIRWCS